MFLGYDSFSLFWEKKMRHLYRKSGCAKYPIFKNYLYSDVPNKCVVPNKHAVTKQQMLPTRNFLDCYVVPNKCEFMDFYPNNIRGQHAYQENQSTHAVAKKDSLRYSELNMTLQEHLIYFFPVQVQYIQEKCTNPTYRYELRLRGK